MYFFMFSDYNLTTYGALNKTAIDKGLSNYKIFNYGQHDFHEILKICNLSSECVGHILQVESETDAVWIKLNYENLLNPNKRTKFIGLYGPINIEYMDTFRQEYQLASYDKSELTRNIYLLSNTNNSLHYFTKNFNIKFINEDITKNIEKLMKDLENGGKLLERKKSELAEKMEEIKKSLKEYINTIKIC